MATMTAPFQVATHNGIITIKSRTTGEHRTLRIHTQAADAKFAAGERVAEILSGPDNTGDYRGFAFVKSTDAEFDALVAEANKVGFRELSRKLL